jgi:hypothetical protein
VGCNLTSYNPVATPPPITKDNRPFSSIQPPYTELAAQLKKLTPPAPALPPADIKAAVTYPLNRARITWTIPADQTSLHRTIAWYQVWRRPQTVPPTNWFIASGKLPATAIYYNDPDKAATDTQYTVCAMNIGGNTCAPAVAAAGYVDKSALTVPSRNDGAVIDKNAIVSATAKSTNNLSALSALAPQTPTILGPTAGQSFVAQTPVPIKIAPQAGRAASYLINIQRKDANGNWVNQLTVPVASSQAESAGGYTGFGNPGPGNGAVYYSGPGAWRVNAQVSSPTQSVWSNWTEFTVVAPVITQRVKK